VSQSSSASNLVRFALASLPGGAPRPNGRFARIAILQLFALLCAVTAMGCALVALWIYAAPTLGAAGALCAVSAVLFAVGLSAFAFERRARESRARSSVPDLGTDVLLAGGSSFFHRTHADRRYPRGSPFRRPKLDAVARRRGMSSFRGCSSRPAALIVASDTSTYNSWSGEVIR
jgi:hypothetical protein